MKRRCHSTFRLIAALAAPLLLFASFPARAQAGQPRALLIGISTYDAYNKSGLFPNLDCAEDVKRIKAALVSTFQFNPDPAARQITTLTTPAQTTRAALWAALDALAAQTGPGDIVYIHYSGHGSQVPDRASPGGLDDALVPSDYQDDQSNEITGKQIAAFLKRLQAKGPAQVTLSFDCCHSATVTRGAAKKRGLSWGEYARWYQEKHGVAPAQPVEMRPPVLQKDSTRPQNVILNDLDRPGYVVISACANDACAFETQDASGVSLGRLSDALSRALAQATPQTTYRQVFDRVDALFRQKYPDQAPQMDGSPDTRLFGGRAEPPAPSLLVSLVPPDGYAVDAGKLQGVTVGSVYAVYAPDAAAFTPTTQIAEAVVARVGLTSSTVTITRKTKPNLMPTDLSAAHAVETVHDYGAFRLTIDAESVRQALPAQASAILQQLQTAGMVSTNLPAGQTADIKVVRLPSKQARGTAPVALARGDTGTPIVTLDAGSGDVPALFIRAVEQQARFRYVSTVLNRENTDSGVQIKLRLVPAATGTDADGNTIWKADLPIDPHAATPVFHVGDYFTVEAQNPGDATLFLAVLDMDSDGSIGQAWPGGSHLAQDNVLKSGKPGEWVKLWNGSDTTSPALFHATTPDPNELYKAIATDTYVSFKAIADRAMTRSPRGPFDVLFGPATGVAPHRGAETVSAPAAWATDTVAFCVEPTPDKGRGIPAMSK